jgi:glycosyltransferase involved in cell wall biosynthesis
MKVNINITVVIPTYNRKKNLLEALNSVVSQSYAPIEILIINDNKYPIFISNKSHLIRVINSGGEKGASFCRNIGIIESMGDYIAFLDDDDLWTSNYLMKISNIINLNQVQFISTSYSTFIIFLGKFIKLKQFFPNQKLIYKQNSMFGCSCMVVSRKLLVKIGMFDTELKSCQDWDLWIRLIQSEKNYKLNEEPLVLYQRHFSPSITKSFENRYLGIRRFYFKHKSLLDRKILDQLLISRYAINTKNYITLVMCKSPVKIFFKILTQKIKFFIINVIN